MIRQPRTDQRHRGAVILGAGLVIGPERATEEARAAQIDSIVLQEMYTGAEGGASQSPKVSANVLAVMFVVARHVQYRLAQPVGLRRRPAHSGGAHIDIAGQNHQVAGDVRKRGGGFAMMACQFVVKITEQKNSQNKARVCIATLLLYLDRLMNASVCHIFYLT